MAIGLLGSLFGPSSQKKRSKTVSSSPRDLDAPTTTTPSNEAAAEAQAELPGPRPPSPFTLSTAFDRSRDHTSPSSPVESSLSADIAFTERLASSKYLSVQVDPTHHIQAWLSDVPESTPSPLSRNPSVQKKLKPRSTATSLASQEPGKTSTEPLASEPSPPDLQAEGGNIGTLKCALPDSAMFEMAQAKERIEVFKNSTEYQAYLQDKDKLSCLVGSLAETSLKDRIEFFESLEIKDIRNRISDFEAAGAFETFVADSKLVEAYERP